MQFRIGGIKQYHSPGSEYARIKTRKGRAHRLSRTICVAKNLRRFRITEERGGFFHNWSDLVSESHFAHWRARSAVAGCSQGFQ